MQTTIEFRGMQATYTFPVGVTTLWWYAPNQSNGKAKFVNANATAPAVHTDAAPVRVHAHGEGVEFEDADGVGRV